MKKKLSIFVVSLFFLFSSLVFKVSAKPSENVGKGFSLPSTAVRMADDVYYLGKAKDIKGKDVEGYAFLLRHNVRNKPEGKSKAPACYRFLSKGSKWKIIENYLVDTKNSGLDDSLVRGNLKSDIAKWEDAADGRVDGWSRNILGDETQGIVDGADTVFPDGKNEIYFDYFSDNNTIAVTIVWGIFDGPVLSRELIEWDQVYNIGYSWSLVGEPNKMDFDNIATHELGHVVGMGDVYNLSCSEVTMYGYAIEGETKKRDLEGADIKGVFELYR